MHADRTNRLALTVLGLLLAVIGAAGCATSVGVFGAEVAHHALFDNVVSRWIGARGGWLWPVAAAVALVLVLLCLRWIVALLVSTDRAGDLTVAGDKSTGRTTVVPSAVTSALTTEIATYRGVDTARARLVGDSADPRLVVSVTAGRSVDLGQLRRRIEDNALAHARHVLDRPDLPIRFDLSVSRHTPDRVR